MLTLIYGGSASGKSEYAENYAMNFHGTKTYIATMIPFCDESLSRIKNHRKMRETKGFNTVECPKNLAELKITDDIFLLECLGNLLGNEMFLTGDSMENILNSSYIAKIMEDLTVLNSNCNHLIIVSNDIFSEGKIYDKSTEHYRDQLGHLHKNIVKIADSVIEVVYSIPIKWR